MLESQKHVNLTIYTKHPTMMCIKTSKDHFVFFVFLSFMALEVCYTE